MTPSLKSIATSLALLAGVAAAHAADVGQHPAVFTPRALPSVDHNTFRVGHPAGPVARDAQANAPHPAVAQAPYAGIDPNHFLVQPPASVRWLAPAVRMSAAPRAVSSQ